jgi:hypothetical protein
MVAGTTTSGSLWGIGVLVADAAAGSAIPVVELVADGKVLPLVGEAEAGEVGMVVRVLHPFGFELLTRAGRSLSRHVGGVGKR